MVEEQAGTMQTQGGGTVKWDKINDRYVFVDPPSGFDFEKGDFMPEQWGIIWVPEGAINGSA